MDTPEAIVVSPGAGTATVSVAMASACPRCASGRGCGAGLLQQGKPRVLEVRVAEGLVLEAGDRVSLSLAPELLLRAAVLAYGLPLAALLAAVALASGLFGAGSELALVSSGAAGLSLGALAARRILRKDRCLHHMLPTATRKIGKAGEDVADRLAAG